MGSVAGWSVFGSALAVFDQQRIFRHRDPDRTHSIADTARTCKLTLADDRQARGHHWKTGRKSYCPSSSRPVRVFMGTCSPELNISHRITAVRFALVGNETNCEILG
jgi:hypothetical protein